MSPERRASGTTPPPSSSEDMATAAVLQQSAHPQQGVNKRYRPTPAKTFQCRGYGECRMVFSRSEHLARHIRKHTGERPFTCHCGKQFSRLDNLRQHAQTVHSDKQDQNERMMRELTSLHASMAAANKASSRGGRRAGAGAVAGAGVPGVVSAGQIKVEESVVGVATAVAAAAGRPGTSTGYEGANWQITNHVDDKQQQQQSFPSPFVTIPSPPSLPLAPSPLSQTPPVPAEDPAAGPFGVTSTTADFAQDHHSPFFPPSPPTTTPSPIQLSQGQASRQLVTRLYMVMTNFVHTHTQTPVTASHSTSLLKGQRAPPPAQLRLPLRGPGMDLFHSRHSLQSSPLASPRHHHPPHALAHLTYSPHQQQGFFPPPQQPPPPPPQQQQYPVPAPSPTQAQALAGQDPEPRLPPSISAVRSLSLPHTHLNWVQEAASMEEIPVHSRSTSHPPQQQVERGVSPPQMKEMTMKQQQQQEEVGRVDRQVDDSPLWSSVPPHHHQMSSDQQRHRQLHEGLRGSLSYPPPPPQAAAYSAQLRLQQEEQLRRVAGYLHSTSTPVTQQQRRQQQQQTTNGWHSPVNSTFPDHHRHAHAHMGGSYPPPPPPPSHQQVQVYAHRQYQQQVHPVQSQFTVDDATTALFGVGAVGAGGVGDFDFLMRTSPSVGVWDA
ncbi:rna polymerase ii transcription [Moniliophthora roreri]|nr:rna polymerase ii transcription [Moniliophthora roreri]